MRHANANRVSQYLRQALSERWEMRARRTDANLTEIVKAYRRMGCKVRVNNDNTCDCIVQFGGVTDLVECKDGSKPPSARKLTPNEEKTHEQFMIRIVTGLDQVADHVGALRRKSQVLMHRMVGFEGEVVPANEYEKLRRYASRLSVDLTLLNGIISRAARQAQKYVDVVERSDEP